MRDIPVFATEYGVGSLILKEVPYKQTAYIKIYDTSAPEAFLEECVGFCRAVGAQYIYASGHRCLENIPIYTTVIKMRAMRANLPGTEAVVRRVTRESAQNWRGIYNQRMDSVLGAAYMDQKDMDAVINSGCGYFVYQNEVLIGIGIARNAEIEAVAAVQPGAGRDVLLALCSVLDGEEVDLEVSTSNGRAMRLYEALGFTVLEEKMCWHEIL